MFKKVLFIILALSITTSFSSISTKAYYFHNTPSMVVYSHNREKIAGDSSNYGGYYVWEQSRFRYAWRVTFWGTQAGQYPRVVVTDGGTGEVLYTKQATEKYAYLELNKAPSNSLINIWIYNDSNINYGYYRVCVEGKTSDDHDWVSYQCSGY